MGRRELGSSGWRPTVRDQLACHAPSVERTRHHRQPGALQRRRCSQASSFLRLSEFTPRMRWLGQRRAKSSGLTIEKEKRNCIGLTRRFVRVSL